MKQHIGLFDKNCQFILSKWHIHMLNDYYEHRVEIQFLKIKKNSFFSDRNICWNYFSKSIWYLWYKTNKNSWSFIKSKIWWRIYFSNSRQNKDWGYYNWFNLLGKIFITSSSCSTWCINIIKTYGLVSGEKILDWCGRKSKY